MIRSLPQGDCVAATHYQTLQDPDADGEAIVAAMKWLEGSETRGMAYGHIARLDKACADIVSLLPPEEIAAALQHSSLGRLRHSGVIGRHFLALAASLVPILAIGLGVLLFIQSKAWPPAEKVDYARYSTSVREIRSIALPDRSIVTLGGASAVRIAYNKGTRRIFLTDGEALFKVTHDPERPFTVETLRGSVRATGTQFDVHRTPRGTAVTVLEGSVNVTARGTQRVTTAMLKRGMQVNFSAAGELSPIRWVDARRATSWRTGQLRFLSQPLEVIVADLNRYSENPIILASPELRAEEITGSVRTDRILEWLEGMAASRIVDLTVNKDGSIILKKAQVVEPVA